MRILGLRQPFCDLVMADIDGIGGDHVGAPDMVLLLVAVDKIFHRLIGHLGDRAKQLVANIGWGVDHDHAFAGGGEHGLVDPFGDPIDPAANFLDR